MNDLQETKRRSRTINRLSAREVETAATPGVLMDGGGLMLRIADNGMAVSVRFTRHRQAPRNGAWPG